MKVNNAINVPTKRIIMGIIMWIVDKPCLAGTHFDIVRMSTIGIIMDTNNAGHNTHRCFFPNLPSSSHRESETVSNAMEGESGRM